MPVDRYSTASGKATISLNRTLEDDTVQEADIKDIKSPNYFGEGRVLGDSRAYASVRAKEELVVYYICLLYTSPSPRDGLLSRMPSSA